MQENVPGGSEIGRTSDGCRITISVHDAARTRSRLIMLPKDEWRKPGLIEEKVRGVVADLADPGRLERSLLPSGST